MMVLPLETMRFWGPAPRPPEFKRAFGEETQKMAKLLRDGRASPGDFNQCQPSEPSIFRGSSRIRLSLGGSFSSVARLRFIGSQRILEALANSPPVKIP